MALGPPGSKTARPREEYLGKKLERHRPARPLISARFLVLVLGLLAVTAACGDAATPASPTIAPTAIANSTEAPAIEPVILAPAVRVGTLEFPVEVADDPAKRIRGLSGRASLDAGTGMLFVFENEQRFRFWMREMEISLDMVWIGSNCQVVDVSENVPFPDPGTPTDDLPRYSPESPAKYVLEINGGESADLGLGIGDQVEFVDQLAGRYGC